MSSSHAGSRDDAAGRRLRSALVWLALGLALLPVLLDLGQHMWDRPWARYALVFPPLVLWAAWAAPETPAPGRDGFLWLGLGLLLALAALGSGVLRIGRPGAALAAIGLCRIFGDASLRVALLALWAVPVPHLLLLPLGAPIQRVLSEGAASLVGALGGEVRVVGSLLSGPAGDVQLRVADAGILLAVLLSGLGWFAALRRGADVTGCVRGAALWGLAGLPLQAAAVVAVAACVALGAPGRGRALLDHGPLVVAGAGLAFAIARTPSWRTA